MNAQVARLIVALGENDKGRMAILKAVAERQGIEEETALQDLISGRAKPEDRLRVPGHLRVAMCKIGLHEALLPINVITTVEQDGAGSLLIADEAWTDIEFEVALDSGAVIHVCSTDDCPGYFLEESGGSKRGQKFLMGDGGEISNLGQKSLNLCDLEGNEVQSVFQIAAVTRPLMSVGRICDEGHEVTFNAVDLLKFRQRHNTCIENQHIDRCTRRPDSVRAYSHGFKLFQIAGEGCRGSNYRIACVRRLLHAPRDTKYVCPARGQHSHSLVAKP
jgi:hypothetical protein